MSVVRENYGVLTDVYISMDQSFNCIFYGDWHRQSVSLLDGTILALRPVEWLRIPLLTTIRAKI